MLGSNALNGNIKRMVIKRETSTTEVSVEEVVHRKVIMKIILPNNLTRLNKHFGHVSLISNRPRVL